jgi:hypothetical protein
MKENFKFNRTLENKVDYLLMYLIRYLLRMESSACSLKDAPALEIMCTTPSLIDSSVYFNKSIKSPSVSSIKAGQYVATS